MRRPPNPAKTAAMVDRMGTLASSPAIAIVGAGAALANPGAFIPIALKAISQTNPTAAQYVVDWLFFSLVSLLPLAVALVFLLVARERTSHVLSGVRNWLERNARTVAAVIVVLLAVALIRNGIAGLT
jgi:Sap, sulfolipid-1-addressing protein